MSDWPVGLSTGAFAEKGILDCLDSIREGGFGLIEVCCKPKHLDYHDRDMAGRAADRIRELGIEPYSLHAPFADEIDITATDRDARRRARDDILMAVEAAAILTVRHFVIHPGPERGGFSGEDLLRRMENAVEELNHIASRCKELGVGFVLENMLPHLFAGRARELLWILGGLRTREVGICLDTGHAYLSGDLLDMADKLCGHLWMLHASDNKGEYDDHLPAGDGKIPWKTLMKRLVSVPFTGAVILEIRGKEDPAEVMADARRGRRYLRDIARRLGIPGEKSEEKEPTERKR